MESSMPGKTPSKHDLHAVPTSFVASLKACAKMKDLCKGTRLHADLLQRGFLAQCSSVADALVFMYAKCGALAKAKDLLHELLVRNVLPWTALILGYVQLGQSLNALACFERMQQEGIPPSAWTYSGILKACGSVRALDKGEIIHDEIANQGLLANDVVLGTALVDMYAKCGAFAKAESVLLELPTQDVFAWTALITGYAQHGQSQDALNCFEQMKCKGVTPGVATFACILKACGNIGEVDKGEQVHETITRNGLLKENTVLGNALVDMYAKCGILAKAHDVLEDILARNVVSWNALITGCVEQSQGSTALDCFARMQHEGLSPNAVTFIQILKTCGSIGAIEKGEQIHARQGSLVKDILLGTTLVDMYAKCGALSKARKVLKHLSVWDVACFNALVAGYAQQGQSHEALDCFNHMHQKGLSPNAFTFSCVLNACRHSGLVDEGLFYFRTMSRTYGIKPNVEHYACMVDLFGRAGHLDKAVSFIDKMPSSYDYFSVWHALLGACQKWQDVNIGRWAFEHAIQAEKSDASSYVTMANIYRVAGMQEDVEIIEAMRAKNKAWKERGYNELMYVSANSESCFSWDPGIENTA